MTARITNGRVREGWTLAHAVAASSLIAGMVLTIPCLSAQEPQRVGSGGVTQAVIPDGTSAAERKVEVVDAADVTESTTGKSLAIIIAAQDYTSLPKLKYCQADGRLVAETLRVFCDFDTVVLLAEDASDAAFRPTLGNLSNQLRNWLKVANGGEYRRVLVYFGGHAFRDAKDRLYFAPPDCDPNNLELTALPQAYVMQMLDSCSRVQMKFLVLDCCHAGEDKGEGVGVSSAAMADLFKTAKGLLTLASCSDKEVSIEWNERRHGLYTYWFCQGLEGRADDEGNRNGVVDHQELQSYVKKNVLETAARLGRQQTPVLRPSDSWNGIAPLCVRQSAKLPPSTPPPVETKTREAVSVTVVDTAGKQVSLTEVQTTSIDLETGDFTLTIPVAYLATIRSVDDGKLVAMTTVRGKELRGRVSADSKLEGIGELGAYTISMKDIRAADFTRLSSRVDEANAPEPKGYFAVCEDTQGVTFALQPCQCSWNGDIISNRPFAFRLVNRHYLPIEVSGCRVRIPFADIECVDLAGPRSKPGEWPLPDRSVVVKLRDGRVAGGELSGDSPEVGLLTGTAEFGLAKLSLHDLKRLSFDHSKDRTPPREDVLHVDIAEEVSFDSGFVVRIRDWAGHDATLHHGGVVDAPGLHLWEKLEPELSLTWGRSQVLVGFDKIRTITFREQGKPDADLVTAAGATEEIAVGSGWIGGSMRDFGPAWIHINDIASLEISEVERVP